MKKGVRVVFTAVFLSLICANVYIFVSTMQIGDKINHYEEKTLLLREENIELEKKAYQSGSLEYTASQAALLDFDQKVEPIYIESLPHALK